MKTYISIISTLFIFLTSCIENDIPYPYIKGEIKTIQVEGQIGDAKIDNISQTVSINVDESVELERLQITKLIITDKAKVYPDAKKLIQPSNFPDFSFEGINFLPNNANTRVNFSHDVAFLIKTYQDYTWTVSVNQIVDRDIQVSNQVGEAIIDSKNKIVLIYVSEDQPLNDITIEKLNVEGVNTILSPLPSTVKDFTRPQKFSVKRGKRDMGVWTIEVAHTQSLSTIKGVDTWAKRAIAYGGVKNGTNFEVEYKQKEEQTWHKLSQSNVKMIDNSNFEATIKPLKDGTDYMWRIVVEGQAGNAFAFKTERIAEVPNLNFDTWTQKGKNWYANTIADNSDENGAYWATGNEGVTSALAGGHEPVTVPVEGEDAYKGKAAKMRSITEKVTLVGAAAGNLFIGKYKTNAFKPSASVNFGRPYSGARPDRLKGYYKYLPKPITNNGKIPGNLTKDECHIYIRLWATNGEEIAYGEFSTNAEVNNYKEFDIKLEYKNKQLKPSQIAIVATSSRYGGEFEGAKIVGQVGHGSTLWIDEFELIYE